MHWPVKAIRLGYTNVEGFRNPACRTAGILLLQTEPKDMMSGQNHLLQLQAAVRVRPQEWWQHAVHAVLQERSQLQGTDVPQLSCVARRHLRLEYNKLYSQHQWSKTW